MGAETNDSDWTKILKVVQLTLEFSILLVLVVKYVTKYYYNVGR